MSEGTKMDDPKAFNRLSAEIYEVVKGEDPEAVFSALVDQFIFHMSLVCPDCRKNIARKLRKSIPLMLAHANEVAATYDEPPASCH
jgi:hypothetical protein